MKRLFIVHGWSGSPDEPLIKWLGEQGKVLGFDTQVLSMPGSATPTIPAWVNHLESVVQYPDLDTYFIGHSIGCQAIFRYLQSSEIMETGGVVSIAPWFVLTGVESAEDKSIAAPWLENPIDFRHLKQVIKNHTAIFSDNDSDVPLKENEELFTKNLGPKIIVEHDKGHFTAEDNVVDLPIAIEELKGMSS